MNGRLQTTDIPHALYSSTNATLIPDEGMTAWNPWIMNETKVERNKKPAGILPIKTLNLIGLFRTFWLLENQCDTIFQAHFQPSHSHFHFHFHSVKISIKFAIFLLFSYFDSSFHSLINLCYFFVLKLVSTESKPTELSNYVVGQAEINVKYTFLFGSGAKFQASTFDIYRNKSFEVNNNGTNCVSKIRWWSELNCWFLVKVVYWFRVKFCNWDV